MTYVLSNLDFEYTWGRWESSVHGEVPKKVLAVARRWEAVLRLVAPGAQVLGVEAARGDGFPHRAQGRRFVAWGWTPPVVDAAKKSGLRVDAPPLEVVRRVNSKVFSHRLERRLDIHLPGARLVQNAPDLDAALRRLDGPWLLKHPWGVSGRRQRRGMSYPPSQKVRQWAKAQFRRGLSLVVEPLLDVGREFSFHYDITAAGEVEFVGLCRLLTGRRGTFRGILCGGELDVAAELLEKAGLAAREVADEGYFGPLGIDAMVGMLGNEEVLRPVTEINARYSFGRLALALRDRLGAGDGVLRWEHPAHSESAPATLQPWPEGWTEGRFLLPADVDPHARSGTWVELGG